MSKATTTGASPISPPIRWAETTEPGLVDLSVASATLPRPLRVCLLISSLEFGGAERQVIEMAVAFDRTRVQPFICSLSNIVPLAENNPAVQDILHIVPKRGRFDFTTIPRLARFMRQHGIDVVHAFLLDAEIAARFAAPLAGVRVVIASERNADYVRPRLHQIAQIMTKPLFDVMVANSHAGVRFSVRTLNLDESRLRVVHNGVDIDRFKPDAAAGRGFRERIGIEGQSHVVGMVGSYKRQKDHATFVRMAARVLRSNPECRFLVAGDVVGGSEDSVRYAAEIRDLASRLDPTGRILFLGNQKDMLGFYNACDLTMLLSLREGTPNVALESMACCVPVIASNIADNAMIITDGETGHIVPTGADEMAAEHVVGLLGNSIRLEAMGRSARERICAHFTPKIAAEKLENIYRCQYLAKQIQPRRRKRGGGE